MALLLLPDHRADIFGQFAIGAAVAQARAEVVLHHAEQAGADLAIRGEPEPVAMTAKGFANGGDQSKFPTPVRKLPAPGGLGGGPLRKRPQRVTRLETREYLPARHDEFLQP